MPTKKVEIVRPEAETIRVHIAGTALLLTNRFSEKAIQQIKDGEAGIKRPRMPRDPQSDYEQSRHVIDAAAGRFGFPTVAMKKAIVTAGGRLMKDTMTVLRAAVYVRGNTSDGRLIEIHGMPPSMSEDPAHLPSGGWTMAYRATYEEWEAIFDITYFKHIVPPGRLITLIQLAGETIGIGAWRPETNGTNGTFKLAEAPSVLEKYNFDEEGTAA